MKTIQKKTITRLNWLLVWALVCSVSIGRLSAQPTNTSRISALETALDDYAQTHKALNTKVDISATGTVRDLVNAVVQESKVNLTLDGSLTATETFNFTDTRVRDIILYVCVRHNMTLQFTGSIITLVPYTAPSATRPKSVDYNAYNDKLSLDLKGDTLSEVLKRISAAAGRNVICTKDVAGTIINGYVGKTSFDNAIEQLAIYNGLGIQTSDKGFIILGAKPVVDATKPDKNKLDNGQNLQPLVTPEGLALVVIDSPGGRRFLNIQTNSTPILEVLKVVSYRVGQEYFIYGDGATAQNGNMQSTTMNPNRNGQAGMGTSGNALTTNVSLNLKNATYEEFLSRLLTGTAYTYKLQDGIWLIGDRQMEGFKTTKVVQLQFRSVEKIEEKVPDNLKRELTITPFPELNALVLNGSAPAIQDLELYLHSIDKPVPVVLVEIIITEIKRSSNIQIGAEAGVTKAGGTRPATGGTIYPSVDFTFSTQSINNLFGWLSSKGLINLGPVLPTFYASLQAVEESGIVKIHSKPELSTLNSHEASFTIGQTSYYLQENAVVQSGVTPVTTQTRTAQSAEANFTVKVTPYVGGDEQITLSVEVDQSDFTGRSSTNLPPDKETRKFTSMLRASNGDMIVLGGLEKLRMEDTGKGLPWISRVPILKWFFSKRSKIRNKSELVIFIKPTVVY